MRELLFRGKLKQNGEWVYGHYCQMQETTYAFDEDYKRHPVKTFHLIAQDSMTDWGLPNKLRLYEVDPESVCQYTGFTDWNARKIYEGDILRDKKRNEIVSVWWNELKACFEYRGGSVSPTQIGSRNQCSEVIGNIFDNMDLLEEQYGK